MASDDFVIPPSAPPGLRIERGQEGVPHVHAADLSGLYWGMGFAHATDRALQLLLTRVLGQGRASECLDSSDEMLDIDRFFRRMNWAGTVATEVEKLDEETLALCEAYCGGVNAALGGKAPWELRLLGLPMTPWVVGDSILLMRLIGWVGLAQSQGEIEQLLLAMIQAGLSDELIDDLFPGTMAEADRGLLERVQIGERLVPAALTWLGEFPRLMASNNWVVAPSRSKSGHALLANDPHLEINRIPAVWQELVLETEDRYLLCGTMPGIPAAILGRSADLSWGVTYSFMDAIDSWIEDCRDGCYRRGEDWKPFTERRETVLRKKKKPVELIFWENEHGILDGDPHEPGLYLTRRWAAGEGGARSLIAARKMFTAKTTSRGMALLGRLETSWSWVFADYSGNIGFQMSGMMPLRRGGLSGLLPGVGWAIEDDWMGFAAVEDLPRALNPDCGYLVTANQDLNHLGALSPINAPMGDHRARRIAQLLEGKDQLDLEDFKAIQYDVYSLHAEEFLEAFGPLLPEGAGKDELLAWDRRYDVDSLGAGLFEDFYAGLRSAVFGEAGLGGEVFAHLVTETGIFNDFYARFDRVLLTADSPWWNGLDRSAVASAALASAVAVPRARWGKRNSLPVSHLLFGGKLPLWAGFDRPNIELPGGRGTPQQGQIFRSAGRVTSFAPSIRILVDMAEDCLHSNLPGGPTDRRFSAHYASGWERWLSGEYKRLAPSAPRPRVAEGPPSPPAAAPASGEED
jgi:penicillin amidase